MESASIASEGGSAALPTGGLGLDIVVGIVVECPYSSGLKGELSASSIVRPVITVCVVVGITIGFALICSEDLRLTTLRESAEMTELCDEFRGPFSTSLVERALAFTMGTTLDALSIGVYGSAAEGDFLCNSTRWSTRGLVLEMNLVAATDIFVGFDILFWVLSTADSDLLSPPGDSR